MIDYQKAKVAQVSIPAKSSRIKKVELESSTFFIAYLEYRYCALNLANSLYKGPAITPLPVPTPTAGKASYFLVPT